MGSLLPDLTVDSGQRKANGVMAVGAAEQKSFQFAVRIAKLCRYLQNEKKERIISKQLLRAGTSVGANVVEAEQAQSKADFVSKLSIALKEAVETKYWIRLLDATGFLTEKEAQSILCDCHELEKILTAIIKTAKSNSYKKKG